MRNDYLYIQIHVEKSVVQVSLNRPEHHNAMIPELIVELDQVLEEIAQMDDLQFVILSGNGRSFCTGADLHWFSKANEQLLEQNTAQYKLLADLMLKLYQLPQITIATVRGNVFGGGIGLMAVCDFVLAEPTTRFMFSEVKLGLLPATILPFVAKRLSIQNLRKWILTGILFSAQDAYDAGLVDVLTTGPSIKSALDEFLELFAAASPSALKKAKKMINQVACSQIDFHATDVTSTILAEALLSADGQEGIQAFIETRSPGWK